MNLDSDLISLFLTGVVAVFAMVAIGGAMAHLFRSASRRFPFTRSALILTLPPFCFILFMDRGSLSSLYLYGILMIVLGFTIDGLKHLLSARPEHHEKPAAQSRASDAEADAPRMVWDKAE